MKSLTLILLFSLGLLVACSSIPHSTVPTGSARNYNGTASVGDFLTISVDSARTPSPITTTPTAKLEPCLTP